MAPVATTHHRRHTRHGGGAGRRARARRWRTPRRRQGAPARAAAVTARCRSVARVPISAAELCKSLETVMNLTGEFYSHQTVEIDRELPAQLRRCVAPRQ